METILETLKVYYKGQELKYSEDWMIENKQILLLKPFDYRLIQTRWEAVNNNHS